MEEEKVDHERSLVKVSNALIRLATGRRVLVLLVLLATYSVAVMAPMYRRVAGFSSGGGTFDFLITYSPEQARDMVAAYGLQGRRYYATVAVTLDTVFSLALALAFSLTLTYVFHRAFSGEGVLQRALLVPAAAMVADLLENFGVVTMLLIYPQELRAVALLTSAFSTVKWTAVAAEVVLVVVGAVNWLVRKGLRGEDGR